MIKKKISVCIILLFISILSIFIICIPINASAKTISDNLSYTTYNYTVDENAFEQNQVENLGYDYNYEYHGDNYGHHGNDYDYDYDDYYDDYGHLGNFSILCAIIGAIIFAVCAYLGVMHHYKFKETASASNYIGKNNVNFTEQSDRFIRTRRNRRRINDDRHHHH